MLDFIFVGPMKTGTSWIHEYLSWHTGVNMPSSVKETYYFSKNFEKGEGWFQKQFSESAGEAKTGEVGPAYFPDRTAASRIKLQNPEVKIAITLREPYQRFLSHYYHNVRAGYISEGTPLTEVYESMDGMRGHSQYARNVSQWLELFSEQKVEIMFYEQLGVNSTQFTKSICMWLGIEYADYPEIHEKYVGARRELKSKTLFKFASRSAELLRKHDLHLLVNSMKAVGMAEALYSKKKPSEVKLVGAEDLFNILRSDAECMEKDLGLDISVWKDIWVNRGWL